MDQEMTFSLSYEQLTRFAERRIRECNLRHQWKEAMSNPNKKPPVILIIMASPATIPDGPQ